MAEVAKHNSAEDLWVLIDGRAYDLTAWVHRHPGGQLPLANLAGRDATEAFEAFHGAHVRPMLRPFLIGEVGDAPSDPMLDDFRAVRERLRARGLFRPTPAFYLWEARRPTDQHARYFLLSISDSCSVNELLVTRRCTQAPTSRARIPCDAGGALRVHLRSCGDPPAQLLPRPAPPFGRLPRHFLAAGALQSVRLDTSTPLPRPSNALMFSPPGHV